MTFRWRKYVNSPLKIRFCAFASNKTYTLTKIIRTLQLIKKKKKKYQHNKKYARSNTCIMLSGKSLKISDVFLLLIID